MPEKTVSIAPAGHRPDKLNQEYDLDGPCSNYLCQQLQKLFEELKPAKVISGMALGFDQLLAREAIKAQISVLAAIPCDNQEKVWPKKSQELYKSLLENELVTVYVVAPGPYHHSKMQLRNRWMCDNSDGVVAAWDGSSGGTANCLKYAKELQMSIWYLKLTEPGLQQLWLDTTKH